MAGLSSIANIWNNVKEVDLRPIRDEALLMVKVALVGAPGSGRGKLVEQMRRDPTRTGAETQTPVLVADLDSAGQADGADIIILTLNSSAADFSRERELAHRWSAGGKKVLVFISQPPLPLNAKAFGPWVDWGQRSVVYGPPDDPVALLREFVPAVIELLPDRLISLGRYFPLFRVPIARQVINESSFSNAAYALSTGLAEIVPVFDIPLNVADIVVLTKNQAFLVYKLGLTLGLSTRWQDYVTEFGGVLGGGFVWRQVARSLIGLIPAWGIIPKVSVSYAGTYVVGNVVLQWYLTGRHVTNQQMRLLYSQAFAVGKKVAQGLVSRIPRPKLRPRLRRGKPAELPATAASQRICSNCGKVSAVDAGFCQYCGQKL